MPENKKEMTIDDIVRKWSNVVFLGGKTVGQLLPNKEQEEDDEV